MKQASHIGLCFWDDAKVFYQHTEHIQLQLDFLCRRPCAVGFACLTNAGLWHWRQGLTQQRKSALIWEKQAANWHRKRCCRGFACAFAALLAVALALAAALAVPGCFRFLAVGADEEGAAPSFRTPSPGTPAASSAVPSTAMLFPGCCFANGVRANTPSIPSESSLSPSSSRPDTSALTSQLVFKCSPDLNANTVADRKPPQEKTAGLLQIGGFQKLCPLLHLCPGEAAVPVTIRVLWSIWVRFVVP